MLEAVKNDEKSDCQRIAYVMLTIRGEKFGFDKVLKMIDEFSTWCEERTRGRSPRARERS